jgi:phage shock protein A
MADKTPEMQAAQDLLTALTNQRNNAQNECVQLAANLAAAHRRIAELEAKLGEDKPKKNGRAEPELPLGANF